LQLDYWNTAIIASFIGLLNNGINSVTTPWFVIGFISQFWARRYRANWFIKYNYILSAAMDGGTQVLMFILSFAVFGSSGIAVSPHSTPLNQSLTSDSTSSRHTGAITSRTETLISACRIRVLLRLAGAE
jgi:hypothetical protein